VANLNSLLPPRSLSASRILLPWVFCSRPFAPDYVRGRRATFEATARAHVLWHRLFGAVSECGRLRQGPQATRAVIAAAAG